MAGTLYSSVSSLAGYAFAASGACYELNSDGTIAGPFAANVPAITDEGFKARQSLTNLFTASNPTTGQTDPAGGTTAGLISSDGGSLAVSTATTYAFTTFSKRNATDWVRLFVNDAANAANQVNAWFNLATGAIGSASTLGAGISIIGTPTIISCVDGWFRLTMMVQSASATSLGATRRSVAGNGGNSTTGDFYAWQRQFAAGVLPNGGPIITTNGSAATRGEALLSHNIFADGLALPDQEQLFWVWGEPDAFGGGTQVFAHLSNGTNGERVQLYHDGTNYRCLVQAANASVYGVSIAAPATPERICLLIHRGASGTWRFGKYDGTTLTWAGTAAAGAFGTYTKAHPGCYISAGFALRGTLDSCFIKPGTFDTDQKVIDAITGAP